MNDRTRQLTQRYDREARAYRDDWAPVLHEAGVTLVRELAGIAPRRVLEVGAGVGTLWPDVRAAFPSARITGVDRSLGMLSLAPRAMPRAVMDARRLAVPTGTMDLVLMVFMLFHLEEPAAGLVEARRVLRDGGRIGVLTWAGDLTSEAFRIWDEILDAAGAAPPDPTAQSRHDLVDQPAKMEQMLDGAGFSPVRCWEDDLVSEVGAEHLVRLKTNVGSSKPRFDGLDPGVREACVSEARRRFGALSPKDFVARGRVVYSIGRVEAGGRHD